ncbi:MAG: hypothetical protein Q4Q53_07195 [Methanocorpusculum sp.]|nr:hypothetical protein [Methanocorpusculum sp.]
MVSGVSITLSRSLMMPEYYLEMEIPQGNYIKPLTEKQTYQADQLKDAVLAYQQTANDLLKEGDCFAIYNVMDAYVNQMMKVSRQSTAGVAA